MKIILSTLLLVTSVFAATPIDKSSTHKNADEVTVTGTRIDPNKEEGDLVLTISKEQIENGEFKNIGELLQAASKKSDAETNRPTLESVQELVALMNSRKITENMVELTAENIVNNVALKPTDRIFDEKSAPRYDVYMRAFRPNAILIAKKHFSAQNMNDGLVKVYRNVYTQDEVDILIEMARSEAWKLWQKHNAEIVNGSLATGVDLAKIAVPELVKVSEEALQQARDTEITILKPPAK